MSRRSNSLAGFFDENSESYDNYQQFKNHSVIEQPQFRRE